MSKLSQKPGGVVDLECFCYRPNTATGSGQPQAAETRTSAGRGSARTSLSTPPSAWCTHRTTRSCARGASSGRTGSHQLFWWVSDRVWLKDEHAGDQMVAQGAGVRSARGALGASWIMSDGGARQPRIMSDGGAKQPRIMSDGGARQPRIMYDGGPGMQSHHTHHNFLFGMVHLPPSGGTRWVII
ncbi:hypothetical protein B0H17DRAFT_1144003 [Mycena rosella]|uniref:Uncharacterized protein n=1 Tax=Mycena rosella TaxID=1033263 RepID=A0AAD7CU68_MYCRO|nr:hypothetical protein B0H17DRAFT_1144003 [Mycena rosella]